jgi:hypothetical protein
VLPHTSLLFSCAGHAPTMQAGAVDAARALAWVHADPRAAAVRHHPAAATTDPAMAVGQAWFACLPGSIFIFYFPFQHPFCTLDFFGPDNDFREQTFTCF